MLMVDGETGHVAGDSNPTHQNVGMGRAHGTLRLAMLLLSTLSWAGCAGVTIDGGSNGSDGTINPSTIVDGNQDTTLTSDQGKTSGEPNGDFANAVFAVFDSNGSAKLQGVVAATGDLDVFNLGALARGTRIRIDTDTTALQSNLDVSIALYDAEFRLVNNNDDRLISDLDALVDWIVYNDSSTYYLVVSHSAFAARNTFTGSYLADIQLTTGVTVPEPTPQTILLNFDGGLVESESLGTQQIAPFDASAISLQYDGQDQLMKDAIVASVRENFEGFNIEIITSDDPRPGAGTAVSEVFLGGFSETTFGIAESVDLYNLNRCDDGIIYTESFSPFQFGFVPSAEALAIAIGNVTAHEAGHLLGLNHVDDDNALMDDVSPAAALLDDQEFMEAPVSDDIIPIGFQDAVFLLSDIVGLR
ncbi:MAG: matrixin family metalloprotease [Phycisphaerae bacterium]